MKRMMFMIGAAIAAVFLLSGSVQAVEYKWTGDGFVEVGTAPVAKPATVGVTYRDVVVPPGHHAHDLAGVKTPDGRQVKIIHANDNLNDPDAHAGVARPWYQTGKPGDVVTIREEGPVVTTDDGGHWQQVSPNAFKLIGGTDFVSDCPNGNCPANTGRRVLSYNGTTTVNSTATYASSGNRRVGPIRRLLGAPFRLFGGGCR